MNNSMYKIKKKRTVDPNAPPRPTLLGHEKEMKDYREQFNSLGKITQDQTNTILYLRRKINRMQAQIDAIESVVKRMK